MARIYSFPTKKIQEPCLVKGASEPERFDPHLKKAIITGLIVFAFAAAAAAESFYEVTQASYEDCMDQPGGPAA